MSLRYKGTDLELAPWRQNLPLSFGRNCCSNLVTHSRVDNDVSFDHGEFVAQSVKGAEFYQFDGCGHMFWFGPEGEKVQVKLIDFRKGTQMTSQN